MPATRLGSLALAGLTPADVTARLGAYNADVQSQVVTLTIREQTKTYTFADLGITLDPAAIAAQRQLVLQPVLHVNTAQLQTRISADFSSVITPPQNASLSMNTRGRLQHLAGQAGEAIEVPGFVEAIAQQMQPGKSINLEPTITPAEPVLSDAEITPTAAFALQLLRDGFTLTASEQTWTMTPFTIRRFMTFQTQPRPEDPNRYQLSVHFETAGLAEYLTTTLTPGINRLPQDARFTISENGSVEQSAPAEIGQALNIDETVNRINTALQKYELSAEPVISVSEPAIKDQADIESLDITTLLATGETSFAGSPKNRIHNIKVGTTRYQGLLIPPGAVFSFNQFLGPVTAAAGYKPELVIKHNKTIPEYGGGLCQVSTTVFRAATLAGLGITERRNHAYAVRYYGTPGFDATIYPPNTDFKFTNDTDGYVLMQTKIEGTNLSIELWGKADGREVVIDGPHPYDRQPDGAVKATLKRIVRRGDTVLHDDTFYSRYRSPSLFPKPNENPLP